MDAWADGAAGVLDVAVELVAELYGDAEAARFRERAREAGAADTPFTWQAGMKAELARLARTPRLPSADTKRVSALWATLRERLRAPSEYDRRLLEGSIGGSFSRFLKSAAASVGEGAFKAAIDTLRDVGGWAALVVPGLDRDFSPTGPSFEQRARAAAAGVARAAEVEYRPFLQIALTLTPTKGAPAPRSTVPDTVGRLVRECEAVWLKRGGPTGVLYPGIAVLRNSEGHAHTEFDTSAETVTFVNRSDGKPTEFLGPWTEPQLLAYARGFRDLLTTMALVYRASADWAAT